MPRLAKARSDEHAGWCLAQPEPVEAETLPLTREVLHRCVHGCRPITQARRTARGNIPLATRNRATRARRRRRAPGSRRERACSSASRSSATISRHSSAAGQSQWADTSTKPNRRNARVHARAAGPGTSAHNQPPCRRTPRLAGGTRPGSRRNPCPSLSGSPSLGCLYAP